MCLPCPPAGQPQPWMHPADVLQILSALEEQPVSLRLLEASQISRPVAQLRGHAYKPLAAVATRLANKWRNIAASALDRATLALQGKVPGVVQQ
jgi:hypothetical protein